MRLDVAVLQPHVVQDDQPSRDVQDEADAPDDVEWLLADEVQEQDFAVLDAEPEMRGVDIEEADDVPPTVRGVDLQDARIARQHWKPREEQRDAAAELVSWGQRPHVDA